MKIGLIGSGRMGRPIVDRLVAAGHDVTILARRAEAREAAEADGLSCADTLAATVRDALVVVLTDEQVRSVCLGPDGAIAVMKRGATLVQHTTSDPATAPLLASAVADRGIGVLDAAPVLDSYASPILFVGPLGNGQRVKLVNNALFGALMRKDVTVVRDVARRIGADLGIIGMVLSSDAVEDKVLGSGGTS